MTEKLLGQLIKAGIPSPRMELRVMENYASGRGADVAALVERRSRHEPLDKILHEKPFYKDCFYVDRNVLSPRPETEILVEKAVSLFKDRTGSILDLGTGSGCILLSILRDCPGLMGTGVDKSKEALEIAARNAESLGLSSRADFRRCDWFEDELKGKYDLVVSNPPYIPGGDIETLSQEVRDHDPILALDGGRDGLESYRKLAGMIPGLLKEKGGVLLEVGIGQAERVAEIFRAGGLETVETIDDLASHPRCLFLRPFPVIARLAKEKHL
jgi:release factor glutamine methyltransferase